MYDSAGRLASESIGGEVTASYTYDAYGNRAQKTEPDRVTKYTYNLSNQLILEDVNGNTTGFGYDGNGNLRSQISGAGETYYIYDLMGRMIQSNVNDTVTDYTYDGDGMRLTKTNGEKTINYINDGMYVSGEVSGESVVKYTYGRSLISIDNNGTMGYYHTDEHGNVRQVTDSKGNTLASYEYDAFGQETGTAADYYNPMRYCGEYRDEETGLIYLRARYYDSGIGRFISEDPHWNMDNMIYGDKEYEENEIKHPDIKAIIQAGNLYVYCVNNPMKYTDSSGKNAGAILGGAWSIGGSAAAIDGPLPYGDAVGGAIAVGGTIIAGVVWVGDKVTTYFDEVKAKTISDAITKIKTNNPNDIIIYRSGSGNATNLTPRDIDVTGLSYSTVMPTSGSFTLTSIGTINATGKLTAVQDGATHVSVSPVDSSKMQEWIDSRTFALVNPHEYTKLLQSISVKIK